MTAKDEFYALIGNSLTSEQLSSIRVIADRMATKLQESCYNDSQQIQMEIKALYYELCASFYASGKDFDTFVIRITEMELPYDHIKYVIEKKENKEHARLAIYTKVYSLVMNFVVSLDADVNKESLTTAITNAIVPELIAQKDSMEMLKYKKDMAILQEIDSKIKNGKKITRICFDIDYRPEPSIEANSITSWFWNDLMKFSNSRMGFTEDAQETINNLESQAHASLKRIIWRICVVLVYYKVLAKKTISQKYILTDEVGDFISLEQSIMVKVHILLEDLGQKLEHSSETKVCSALREAYKETKKVKNTKQLSDEVKDKLRSGSGDKFSFKDISDIYLRCFRMEYPSAQEIVTTIMG